MVKKQKQFDLIILNKSFNRDIYRSLNLYKSVKKYNKDKIPFFLSVPKSDYKIFRKAFPKEVKIYTDEEIWKKAKLNIKRIKKLSGWCQQQIIKLSFYKMDKSENYLTIDSDSYFIRDFYKESFLNKEGVPFTFKSRKKNFGLKHAEKMWKKNEGFLNNKKSNLFKAFKFIKDFLGGDVKDDNWNYYVAGFCVWSSKVLKSLEQKIKRKKNWDFVDMIKYAPYEMQWYGQWIELSNIISLNYIEDIFCIINGDEDYNNFLKKYVDIEKDFQFRKYLGITIQGQLKNGKIRYEVPDTLYFGIRNKIRNLRHYLKVLIK